jgi:hypothetical protein
MVFWVLCPQFATILGPKPSIQSLVDGIEHFVFAEIAFICGNRINELLG